MEKSLSICNACEDVNTVEVLRPRRCLLCPIHKQDLPIGRPLSPANKSMIWQPGPSPHPLTFLFYLPQITTAPGIPFCDMLWGLSVYWTTCRHVTPRVWCAGCMWNCSMKGMRRTRGNDCICDPRRTASAGSSRDTDIIPRRSGPISTRRQIPSPVSETWIRTYSC